MKLIPRHLALAGPSPTQARPRVGLEISAPGRVNLIGEHTDYNGGKVLPFAIDLGLVLQCEILDSAEVSKLGQALGVWPSLETSAPTHDGLFVFVSDLDDQAAVVLHSELAPLVQAFARIVQGLETGPITLPENTRRSWARYALGAAVCYLHTARGKDTSQEALPTRSLRFVISSTLPAGGGMSSSAALCTGLLSGFSLAHGALLSADAIAKGAMAVEHHFAGTKCGLMDQLAIMAARDGHFSCIDFAQFPEHGAYQIESTKAHSIFGEYVALAIHTGVSHSLAESQYNLRRQSCETALDFLNKVTGLSASSLGTYASHAVFEKAFSLVPGHSSQKELRSQLLTCFRQAGAGDQTEILAKRAGHAIQENFRVDQAVEALKLGDISRLDQAMRESHWSLKSQYEVSCRELDFACESATDLAQTLASQAGLRMPPIVGCRMTGGGFGGSTIQFIHHGIAHSFAQAFVSPEGAYTQETGKTPTLVFSRPSHGLRVAIH